VTSDDEPTDFFITYAGPDEGWAKWVDHQLREACYTTELDVWDWAAGINIVSALQRALSRARRMVALLSPDYFGPQGNRAALDAAFLERDRAPSGYLVPVLVRPCGDRIPLHLRPLRRIDLVGLGEDAARTALLTGLRPPARPPRGHSVRFPGSERATFPGTLPSVWNLPAPNAFFTGREALLGQIDGRLAVAEAAGRASVVALHGIGGTGKSQLALTYAWRHHQDFRGGWWIDAESTDSVGLALGELATALGLRATGGTTTVAARLREPLGAQGAWLLVYDNVTDLGDLPLLAEGGQVIVTCRESGTAHGIDQIRVDGFGRDESIQLLRRRVPWLTPVEANRVASTTEDLPLAVAQAAAYLATTDEPVAGYLARLRALGPSAARMGVAPRPLTGSSWPADGGHPPVDAHHRGRVTEGGALAATVAAAVDTLGANEPEALRLLQQLAMLAPEQVPLAASSPAGSGAATRGLVIGDPDTAARLVDAMTALDLVRLEGTRLLMHRRVQATVCGLMPETSATAMLGRALGLLATASPGDPRVPATWSDYASLVPHIQAVTRRLEASAVEEPVAFRRLLRDLTNYLVRAGLPAAARALDEAALARRRRALGDDHPDTLESAADLARDLHGLGQHEVARALDEETLLRRRLVLGEEHRDTLTSVNNLANGRHILADYAGARALHEDALAGRRRVLGDDDPQTLTSANNLAADLYALGDHAGARALHEDTLSRRQRVLGDDHPDTLASAYNLALVLRDLGAHARARDLDQETLHRRQRLLGDNHPDTLASAHTLAGDLRALSEFAAARALDEETFERRRQVLGADHPDTLASATNLAVDLRLLAQYRAALTHDEDTLGRRRRLLGPNHPDTLVSAANLALDLRALGDAEKARTLDRDTLARRRRVLGIDHPDTRRVAENLRRFGNP